VRTFLAVSTCVAIALMGPGCSSGPKLVLVKGTVTQNGKPYTANQKGEFQVRFVQLVEKGQPSDSFSANVDRETGAFEIVGRKGDGIPVGKYRIAVQQRAIPMTEEIQQMNSRFGPQNSPFVREIKDETPIAIDLAKPEG
jgi:hypothetical protein